MIAGLKGGLYALAFLWTLLITALLGNVIYDALGGTPSQINFCMFVAVLSWIVLLIGLTSCFLAMIPVALLLIMDSFATLFTFIAAVVLAAKLGVHSCGNFDYLANNDTIIGSPDLPKRCHELQATTAFLWFLFATYCGTLFLNFLEYNKGASSRMGIRKGGPAMSQV